MPRPPIVLASSSTFRAELLARLGIEFEVDAPQAEESPREGENAEQMVMRLAEAKARIVAARHAAALIVGSDQCAVLERYSAGPDTVLAEHARWALDRLTDRTHQPSRA